MMVLVLRVVNHGVKQDHINQVWEAVDLFFKLPRPEKRKLNRSSDNPWGFFDRELLFSVKNGAYLVNTAPGRKWIPKP